MKLNIELQDQIRDKFGEEKSEEIFENIFIKGKSYTDINKELEQVLTSKE
jgi:hypothetical protein